MKKLSSILIVLLLFMVASCDRQDQYGRTATSTTEEVQSHTEESLPETDPYETYILDNHSVINLNQYQKQDYELITQDIKDAKFILTGEIHGVSINSKITMNFLKFIKEETNFSVFLPEIPNSEAYFLNKYLESGDVQILKNLYDNNYVVSNDNYKFWIDLYNYNQTLNEQDKIKVYGIDKEHDFKIALRHLNEIKTLIDLPFKISANLDDIETLVTDEIQGDTHEIYDLLNSIQDELLRLPTEEYNYDSELNDFKRTINGMKISIEYYESKSLQLREDFLYENLSRLYAQHSDKTFFAHWGRSHIMQKTFDFESFTTKLLQLDDITYKQVISIPYVYSNCERIIPSTLRRIETDELNYGLQIHKIIGKENAILLKLNGDNSPFLQEYKWPFILGTYYRSGSNIYYVDTQDLFAPDFFEYMVVLDGSEASTMYNSDSNIK